MTLCKGLENSYMMVSCMFAKESWGVVIVSTSSAGHDNINRMACVNVRDYGLLLQNLVTYEAVKNVAFVMVYFDLPNYRRVCSRITFSCDILSIKKIMFFSCVPTYRQIQPERVFTDFFAPWSRSNLLIFPANWHSGVNQCLEIYPHLDPLIYISSNPKMFLESYSALRLAQLFFIIILCCWLSRCFCNQNLHTKKSFITASFTRKPSTNHDWWKLIRKQKFKGYNFSIFPL